MFRGSQVPEEENKLTGSDPVKVVSTSSESESQKSPKEEIIISEPPVVVDRTPVVSSEKVIFHKVPFTSQAPSGDWDNVIFQQGCEEASMLMAMFWVEGRQITKSGAEKAILAIAKYEQKNYGEFRDTSIEDTAMIMRDYFDYKNIEVKNNINTEDIKEELVNGNLVIVAVNGQKIGNPFYTFPGPLQHMLVVTGYDAEKKDFITNDPGTKRGEAFRYREDILEAALQDYVTGYKEPIIEVKKSMIVVSRG